MTKKALFLATQAEFGGAQRYIFDLAVNLKDRWDVVIAAGLDGSNDALKEKAENAGIRFSPLLRMRRAIRPADDVAAIKEIAELIDAEKPDIIHLNSSKMSVIGTLAAKFSTHRARIVYTAHGWVFNEPLPMISKLLYVFLEAATALLKDHIICLGSKEKAQAKKTLRIPARKSSIIYHGISPVATSSRVEARQKLGIMADDFVIGSIGNLYATKGFDTLIEAARIVKEKGSPIRFAIIGEGALRFQLEESIKDSCLEEIFKLVGAIDGAARYLEAFDIYVCSSVKEGFPYSVLEAMSAGLPIISTRVGGIPEMITDGTDGLLVDAGDARRLADSMLKLYDDENLRIRLGNAARQSARDRFSINQMIDQTEAIYQDLIS